MVDNIDVKDASGARVNVPTLAPLIAANHTDLAAILAKLSDPATQTTLAAVLAKLPTNSAPMQQTGGSLSITSIADFSAGEYETVAASATAQVLGATGGTGDYISGLLVIPATTSPGNVLLLDSSTSITVFAGGTTSVSNLVPFFIPLGIKSVSGAWKVTTGANVSVIGIGNFT